MLLSHNYPSFKYLLTPDSTVPVALGETGFDSVDHLFIPYEGFLVRIAKVRNSDEIFLNKSTVCIGKLQFGDFYAGVPVDDHAKIHWFRRLDITNPKLIDEKMRISPVTFEFTHNKFLTLKQLQNALDNSRHNEFNYHKIYDYYAAYTGGV